MFEDPHHKCWNDVRNALRAVGLWLVVLETTIACNLQFGPFDGAAFVGQIREGFEKYLSVAQGYKDVLFTFLYEGITRDAHRGDLPPSSGTSSDMKRVFGEFRTAKVFTNKGTKVKVMRWFSWFDAVVVLLKCWNKLLLVLCFILKVDGVIKGFECLERRQRDIAAKVVLTKALAKAKAIATDIKKTTQHGNVEVDVLRSTCKESMHLVAKVLANCRTYRLVKIIVAWTGPIRKELSECVEMMHTRRGTREYNTTLCVGAYEDVLREVASKLTDRDVLMECGFVEPPPEYIINSVGFSWDDFDHQRICRTCS